MMDMLAQHNRKGELARQLGVLSVEQFADARRGDGGVPAISCESSI